MCPTLHYYVKITENNWKEGLSIGHGFALVKLDPVFLPVMKQCITVKGCTRGELCSHHGSQEVEWSQRMWPGTISLFQDQLPGAHIH